MSYCHKCRKHYNEPTDEQGDHPCPHCGRLPHERDFRCPTCNCGIEDCECRPCPDCGAMMDADWLYMICQACIDKLGRQVEVQCPHGNPAGECDACDRESDFRFDCEREQRFFGGRFGGRD